MKKKYKYLFIFTLIIGNLFSQTTIETNLLSELGIEFKEANGIEIQGDYAFISSNYDICGLYVLNISNTDSLAIAGFVSLPNCAYDDVAYKDGYIYTGSSIVDVITPEEPVLIGDLGFPYSYYRIKTFMDTSTQ